MTWNRMTRTGNTKLLQSISEECLKQEVDLFFGTFIVLPRAVRSSLSHSGSGNDAMEETDRWPLART